MTDEDIMGVLKRNLKRDEGFSRKPYKDTVGKLTIGYGRNLDDVGITEEEADFLLNKDMIAAVNLVNRNISAIELKPWQVRVAIYNMTFNMGINRLLGFRNMLDAIDKDDFNRAADEALDSKWAAQVGTRATRIAQLFRQAAAD